jgi:Ni,Fe-hydrogenase III small subunit
VVVFPQPSLAVHVLVMLYSFGQEPFVVTSAKPRVGTLQLSVAVGVAKEGVPEHSIVVGPGKPEITGGVVSSTLIVCVAVVILPHPSLAVQVRVILNSLGHEPVVVTSANDSAGTEQLSVAVGTAQEGIAEHSMVVGPGKPEITGGVVSSTLIVCVAVVVLPQPSLAVHVRVILYSLGHDPLVVTSAKVKVGVAQLSVAVGTVQDGGVEHWIMVGPGKAEITGGVVSSLLITWVAVATLPHSSMAVHVRVIVNSFGHEPFVVTSAKASVGVPQLSVTVGVVQAGTAEHSIVVGVGKAEITGGVVSTTLIICTPVDVLPQASIAVQVLVIE